MLAHSKRPMEAAIKPHLRGIVRTAARISPPGSKNVSGVGAKKAGERVVASQIRAIFTPTRSVKRATVSRGEMQAIHHSRRVIRADGVWVRRPTEPIYVMAADLTGYVKEVQGHVGRFAGGFQPSARALGITLPAWMSRHGSRGRYVIEERTSMISFRVINEENYRFLGFENRMRYAVTYQARRIERMLDHYLQEQARRAGMRLAA